MTAELSKEQVEELEALWQQQLDTGDRDDIDSMISAIWSHIPALLTLARSAPSVELVKLGEAAKEFWAELDRNPGCDPIRHHWPDLFDRRQALYSAAKTFARTFARTVEDQRALALTELAELDAEEIMSIPTAYGDGA